MTTAATEHRTRADIERDIRDRRRERLLYSSDRARAFIDAKIDALLDEWQEAG